MRSEPENRGEASVPAGWEGILEPGERILWQGQPVPGLDRSEWLRASNIMPLFVAGFGVVWTITAINMLSDARSVPGAFRVFFPLFGVFFVGMALWGTFGPLWKSARARAGTYYTLSDRAAYIAVSANGEKTIRRFPVAEMATPTLNAAEPGAVYFGTEVRRIRSGQSRGLRAIQVRTGFERINGAREVYRLLREAAEGDPDAS